MKTLTAEVYKQALDLDERDRATLAGLLIESLEEEPDNDLEAAWKAEVQRRIEKIDSGDVEMIPWEDVKARVWQSLNRD
jgi:putative addiction module component (TIGR02574 family)